MTSAWMWAAVRLAVLTISSWGIASFPVAVSNLDWIACALITGLTSTALLVWVKLIKSRGSAEWSDPFSFTKPFFPMNRYPLRFWVLNSYSLILGGGLALVVDLLSTQRNPAFGGTFFFLGLGIFLAVSASATE